MLLFTREGVNKTGAKNVSDYILEVLNGMSETLLHFNLIDKDTKSYIDYTYWAMRSRKGENLNVELVKLDLLNNVDLYTISLKYFQPITVIKEIKENKIDKNFNIIPSKLYTIKMLSKIFDLKSWDRYSLININGGGFFSNYDKTKNIKFFLGKFILDNLHCFNNKIVKLAPNGEKFISERQATILVTGLVTNRLRLDENGEIFGVKIRTSIIKNVKGFSLTDCEEAKRNKKFYVRRSTIQSYNKLPYHMRVYVRAEYNRKYNKELKGTYIHNEEGIYIDKLSKEMLENGSVIKLSSLSTYITLKPKLQKVFVRALELYKFKLRKGNRKNETYSILVDDKIRVQSMLNKLMKKQVIETKNAHPILSLKNIAKILGVSPNVIKDFVNNTGTLFNIPVRFEETRHKGLGIEKELVKKIIEERSKYTTTLKTGIWSKLTSHRIVEVRKLFKDSFYGENLILTTKYQDLLKEIDSQIKKQKKIW